MKVYTNPYRHFDVWFESAQQTPDLDPNAMVLATVDAIPKPSARVVLFKGLVGDGFSFYTNYNSRKGREIATNSHAALLFYWQPLNQQIRIEGLLQKMPRELSVAYFASRPRLSRISSHLSQQSREIPSYEKLEEDFRVAIGRYEGQSAPPCPPYWGGYTLTPALFEFYLGNEHRLNERVVYRKEGDKDGWELNYLSP